MKNGDISASDVTWIPMEVGEAVQRIVGSEETGAGKKITDTVSKTAKMKARARAKAKVTKPATTTTDIGAAADNLPPSPTTPSALPARKSQRTRQPPTRFRALVPRPEGQQQLQSLPVPMAPAFVHAPTASGIQSLQLPPGCGNLYSAGCPGIPVSIPLATNATSCPPAVSGMTVGYAATPTRVSEYYAGLPASIPLSSTTSCPPAVASVSSGFPAFRFPAENNPIIPAAAARGVGARGRSKSAPVTRRRPTLASKRGIVRQKSSPYPSTGQVHAAGGNESSYTLPTTTVRGASTSGASTSASQPAFDGMESTQWCEPIQSNFSTQGFSTSVNADQPDQLISQQLNHMMQARLPPPIVYTPAPSTIFTSASSVRPTQDGEKTCSGVDRFSLMIPSFAFGHLQRKPSRLPPVKRSLPGRPPFSPRTPSLHEYHNLYHPGKRSPALSKSCAHCPMPPDLDQPVSVPSRASLNNRVFPRRDFVKPVVRNASRSPVRKTAPLYIPSPPRCNQPLRSSSLVDSSTAPSPAPTSPSQPSSPTVPWLLPPSPEQNRPSAPEQNNPLRQGSGDVSNSFGMSCGELNNSPGQTRSQSKRRLRQLQNGVSKKICNWAEHANLIEEMDVPATTEGGENETRKVVRISNERRDQLVRDLMEVCRLDPTFRSNYLDLVMQLSVSGVMVTPSFQVISEGPSKHAQDVLNCWQNIPTPAEEGEASASLEFYKAVGKLHEDGGAEMEKLPQLTEATSCSLSKRTDGAWLLTLPAEKKGKGKLNGDERA